MSRLLVGSRLPFPAAPYTDPDRTFRTRLADAEEEIDMLREDLCREREYHGMTKADRDEAEAVRRMTLDANTGLRRRIAELESEKPLLRSERDALLARIAELEASVEHHRPKSACATCGGAFGVVNPCRCVTP